MQLLRDRLNYRSASAIVQNSGAGVTHAIQIECDIKEAFSDIKDEFFAFNRKIRDIVRQNYPSASRNINLILNVIQCNYTEIDIEMECLF